jgi:RNA polymerase sigma-70 factor (ECF subfamily)
VVARVCLNMLRARSTRSEQPFGPHVPDPIVDRADGTDPEQEALLADAVGLALLIVLEALPPSERLAFVLHDMFAVPFDQIAQIMERSPAAARQLASRGRRRVQQADRAPDTDLSRQWEVVNAFEAAAREGDFDALVAVLDPDVVLRTDYGGKGVSRLLRGAPAVAQGAAAWSKAAALDTRRVLVNGQPGVIAHRDGRVFSVGAFTVRGGRIVEFNILADPERLAQLDLQYLPA